MASLGSKTMAGLILHMLKQWFVQCKSDVLKCMQSKSVSY